MATATKTMLYDSRYRVQENKLTGSSGVIAQYEYQEDAAGNITQIHDATDPVFNRDFAYDDLQRLVTANSGASLWGAGTYNYDAMGNMLSTSVTPAKTFSYVGTTPKLLAVATAGVSHSLSYDTAGNETGYIANRTYSARNQLLAMTDSTPAGHTITYGYDGRGIRVTRSESPVGTGTARSVFTYSPELNLLGVARDDGPNYNIDWFGGKPLAQSSGTALRYTFTDHLDTPILQTDATGTVIWRAEYDPYGDVRQMRVGASTDQTLRLPGQEVAMTSEGGEENYNIFRWYRAGWGRYSQDDPISRYRAGEQRYYSYALDSPLNYYDRTGLWTIGRECRPCLNPNGGSRDTVPLSKHIIDETAAFCADKIRYVKDVALRDCMRASCDRGVVRCTEKKDCTDPAIAGYTPMPILDIIARFVPRRTVYVCSNNPVNFAGQAGETVFHEWAHGCGFDPDKGLAGIPRSEP